MAEGESFIPNPFRDRPGRDPMRLDGPLSVRDMLALDRAPKRQATPQGGLRQSAGTYDFQGHSGAGRQLKLSNFQLGDTIRTDGADIRILPDGRPDLRLKPGYENGRSAGLTGPVLMPAAPRGVDIGANRNEAAKGSIFHFYDALQNHGKWDYKQAGKQYEPFGNFHYGTVGRAKGFPRGILFQEAGRAQSRDGNSDPSFGRPGPVLMPFLGSGSFGDDPKDQYWIAQGMRFRRE